MERFKVKAMGADLWSSVLSRIRRRINAHSYNMWFRPTQLESCSGATLRIRVPNPLFAEWLHKNYLPIISQVAQEVDGRSREIVFCYPEADSRTAPVEVRADLASGATGQESPAPGAARPQGSQAAGRTRSMNGQRAPVRTLRFDRNQTCESFEGGLLNSRYTFESFVVGSGNEIAHAAAAAVAEKPSDPRHNPLYVYGGVGLGKTHLVQAIAHALLSSGRGGRLVYVTTEQFMTQLIAAIRDSRTLEFKEHYRGVDVLVVDDIQFLSEKERTQEEFFHTFNVLYDSHKQIVLTSDCAPAQIKGLEERLRSRMGWGLITDIQAPDLETRVAILSKKAEEAGVTLPADVALLVASRIDSNVRDLEGTLNKLLFRASVSGQPVDAEMAGKVIQEVLPPQPAAPTIEEVQKHVARVYDINVTELKSRNNSKSIAFPRQVAMYVCKQMTMCSLPEIGRRFGGKHHTTVLHAVRKIDSLRRSDHQVDRTINSVIASLR